MLQIFTDMGDEDEISVEEQLYLFYLFIPVYDRNMAILLKLKEDNGKMQIARSFVVLVPKLWVIT